MPAPRRLMVPKAPVIVLDGHKLYCLSLDGELGPITPDAAKKLIREHMPITCHGPHLSRFLKIDRFPSYDVLELFAFIHPGTFTVPTARGIARSLHLLDPETPEDMCLSLRDAIRHLLADLTAPGRVEKSDPAAIAAMMGMGLAEIPDPNAGWPWTPVILSTLGRTVMPTKGEMRTAMKMWEKLPEWSLHAPSPPPGHFGVTREEAAERLAAFTHKQGARKKEDRPQQVDYAGVMSDVFAPVNEEGQTHMALAEAGTGTGKTLGYLAPASVWAEKNGGPVWISTYTRNLQKQVDQELGRLYDDPVLKSRKVVTRKGRENYLCLLNLEDATQSNTLALNEENTVALGLMLRWAAVTEEGDLLGKDFPGWLTSLIGPNRLYSFADKRGECIYSACPHFDKCFVEKSIRKSRRADIVIANHALVMHQAAAAVENPRDPLPTRYIFDEGHHIFDAADSAFGIHLNGAETADLRRWILGAETQSRSRARGIKKRLDDLIAGDDEAMADVEAVIHYANNLPGQGWRQRVWEKAPKGPIEAFLVQCYDQVAARNPDAANTGYSIETSLYPPLPGFIDAAHKLGQTLDSLKRPMKSLIARLQKKLENEAEELDTDMRERIQYMISSLSRRADNDLGGWIGLLNSLTDRPDPASVDWLEITRIEGHDNDVGFYRAYIDPVSVFATTLKPHVHGIGVTSATLRDVSEDDLDGWKNPHARSGTEIFSPNHPVTEFAVASPFNYTAQTKIFVIKDVKKDDVKEVAGAFKALFMASGGGALGIFTAVQRLKAIQQKIVEPLEAAGFPLYAQHADPLDIATLIDIFKEEENACLLGTDATRDGIDVPGRSLRMVVYDRVPWPRPTLLHKARRDYFGRNYEFMLTRFKIKQAFGRLIRKHDDKGVFVMLDSQMPSKLAAAFPPGVEIEKVGLMEAVTAIRAFLSDKS